MRYSVVTVKWRVVLAAVRNAGLSLFMVAALLAGYRRASAAQPYKLLGPERA